MTCALPQALVYLQVVAMFVCLVAFVATSVLNRKGQVLSDRISADIRVLQRLTVEATNERHKLQAVMEDRAWPSPLF